MPTVPFTPFAGLKTLPVLVTNEGAVALQVEQLPPAASAEASRTYYVQNVNGIQVTAAAGDSIRNGASVTILGGTATSVTSGSCLWLVPINATEWVALSSVGVWVLL